MDRLLTVKDLSELLQVSPKTVYQWTHVGFIPHYKLPKGVRFGREEIFIWLKHKKKKGRQSYKKEMAL